MLQQLNIILYFNLKFVIIIIIIIIMRVRVACLSIYN